MSVKLRQILQEILWKNHLAFSKKLLFMGHAVFTYFSPLKIHSQLFEGTASVLLSLESFTHLFIKY